MIITLLSDVLNMENVHASFQALASFDRCYYQASASTVCTLHSLYVTNLPSFTAACILQQTRAASGCLSIGTSNGFMLPPWCVSADFAQSPTFAQQHARREKPMEEQAISIS